MSKIDEAKLLDNLGKIKQQITDLIQLLRGTIKPEEAFGNPINHWILTEGPNGPFELLKFMDTEEYRMLRAETEKADHPIRQTFNGKPYTVWLMRDGETIGRKPLKEKGEGKP